MQAADFMSDVAGSDHAVLVLKDWRNRTQEDLLAEVADDLGFGEGSDEEEMTLNGLDAVPVSQGRAFFARLGFDTETDLMLTVEDWREHTRDELLDKLTDILDEYLDQMEERDTQAAAGEDDEALLEANIAQALYDSIDAQIEAKLAESQKLREEAEEMIDQMRATRGGTTGDDTPAGSSPICPDFKTQVEFNSEMRKSWNRGDFSPFNW